MQKLLLLMLFMLAAASTVAAHSLTIAGGETSLTLDRKQLESLPQTTITTTTPYFDGEMTFSGPSLQRVLQVFGLSDENSITFSALNDYRVNGTLEEVTGLDAIIATRMNGQSMSVRNRGPFWIMLPLSERPELNSEAFHRYMVWQLSEIILE